MLLKLSL